tara:strand:- start:2432 stop:2836 length:405 start_codon:yes stop_codon:yes gene_type:complete
MQSEKSEKDTMEELMNKELENRFNRSWSKLDKGAKMNRIHLYIKNEKIEKSLDDNQEQQLKTLLVRIFNSGGLNKLSEIDYCQETKKIIEIKNLTYDEEEETYSFRTIKKKKTEVSKSKSNIDRHFSRSKENKR